MKSIEQRKMGKNLCASLVVVVSILICPDAFADPDPAYCAEQKQPYCFDVNLAEKPAEVQSMINEYSQGLPVLPVHRLTETEFSDPLRISLFHEATAFLSSLLHANQEQDYVWPRDVESCAGHIGFAIGTVLIDDAPQECTSVLNNIQAALSNLDACGDAAEPELYVLDYPPGVVNDDNTNTVLDLIGVMGSTFADLPPLYDGIIQDEFVNQLRDVLRKLRYDELIPPLETQIASFENALTLLKENSSCFIPEGMAALETGIEQLILEAVEQRDYIRMLRITGEAEYEKEKLRLAAISRSRLELPYPSLTQADREFLAFWIGAVYWRLRGGGIILLGGTQECRRLGLRRPFNVIGELTGMEHGKEAADGIYCEIFSGWGQWFDMGTTPGQEDKFYDLVKMTNRGYEQIRTAETGSTVLNPCTIPDPPFVLNIGGLKQKQYETTELFAGGLTMGPCYYYAWYRLHPWTWADDLEPPYIQVVDIPTAIGEFCAGGSIALGMARTLLYGWSLNQPPYGHTDAIIFTEPEDGEHFACAHSSVFARVTVIPLNSSGGPLGPGQDVSLVEDPPYVVGGNVESFTDPLTGVTEYMIEVGSNRCSFDTPYDIQIRVGDTVLQETTQIHFHCPPLAEDSVSFYANPDLVAADGVSTAEIQIQVKDICSNPAFGRVVNLQVLGDLDPSLSTSTPTTMDAPGDPKDGVALLEVSSDRTGSMGLAATIDERVFHSSAELVTFTSDDIPDGGVAGDGGVDTDGAVDGSDSSKSGCSCRVYHNTKRGIPFSALLVFLAAVFAPVFRPTRKRAR